MKLNLSFQNEKYTLEITEDENIGEAVTKFIGMLKDESIKESDLRLVGLGKFLDKGKTFKEEGIKDGTPIKVMKTLPQKDKKKPTAAPKSTGTTSSTNTTRNEPANPFMNNNAFPQMGGLNNNITPSVINNQMDHLLNDQGALDMTMRTIMPNATDEERELYKKQFVENCKRFRENPELMNQMSNQMHNMMSSGNMGNLGNMNPATQNNPPYMPASPSMNPQMNPNMPYSPYNMYNTNPYYFNPYAQQYPVPSPTIPCCHGFYPPNYQFPAPEEDLEQKFENELKTMNDMGYKNKKNNLHALKHTKGNVNDAVNFLCDFMGGMKKE